MPIISVKNLKKYYQITQKDPGLSGAIKSLFNRQHLEVRAVDDISFEIEPGELIGFIGPNGAGKTTTLKTLSGLLYPTSGSVEVLGYKPWERDQEFQKQFSLVMGQKNQLLWDLPAIESFNLNKAIYEVSDSEFQKTLNELVELLEVEDLLSTQVRKLSLGQRMKMELIAALIHSPKILFLDEPTIGLDVLMQKKIRDFIRGYNDKFQATVILTSHYMEDVKELCRRVIIIDKGQLLFDGELEEIVSKFADHKSISVEFEQKVDRENLATLGKIEEFDDRFAVLRVKRSETAATTYKLLKDFKVVDLNIEEDQIEDIIREIFTRQKV